MAKDKPDKPVEKEEPKKEELNPKDKKDKEDKPEKEDPECTHEKEKNGCDQCPEHVFSCEDSEHPKPPIPGAPGPLPIVGIFAAYNQSRKIRNRIKNK